MCSTTANPGPGSGTATPWTSAWADFQSALSTAIAGINPTYIDISQYDYLTHSAVRTALYERAYCYELYHQLRLVLDRITPPFPYTLHGELSKLKGNSTTQHLTQIWNTLSALQQQLYPSQLTAAPGSIVQPPAVRGFIPDFIVHQAGAPDNLVVVEVKTSTVTTNNLGARAIADDIRKLAAFVDPSGLGYHKGIFLVFGDNRPVITNLSNVPNNIDILWHGGASHGLRLIHSQDPGSWAAVGVVR